jgi:uncharacterized membrane protein
MMRILFLLFSLALLVGEGVYAFQISSYNVSVDLDPGDVVHERISIEMLNTEPYPLTGFSYALETGIQNLRAYDEGGALPVELGEGESLSFRLREPLEPQTSHRVTLEFDTTGYITAYPEVREFSMVLHPPPNTRSLTFRLTLPEGAVLPKPLRESLTTSDVVPLPDDVSSDGRSTTFEWRRAGGGDFSVYVKYALPEAGSRFWRGLLATALVLLALSYGLYRWRRKGGGEIEYLREDERLVVGKIMENEGIDQREVQEKTGFSKAKVSNIVSELENRGIVRKEKVGRRNKLYLTKEFKKS